MCRGAARVTPVEIVCAAAMWPRKPSRRRCRVHGREWQVMVIVVGVQECDRGYSRRTSKRVGQLQHAGVHRRDCRGG